MSHLTVEGTSRNYNFLIDNGITRAEIEFAYWQTKNVSWPDFVWDWAIRIQKGAR